MRVVLVSLLFALIFLPLRLLAQDIAPQDTIRKQIDAFLRDDFLTAFTYASPLIQGMFGTSDNFGMMVKRGYPMVYRPSDTRMLGQDRNEKGGVLQQVEVTDQAGKKHYLEYEMIETGQGWRINGVRLITAPDIGV